MKARTRFISSQSGLLLKTFRELANWQSRRTSAYDPKQTFPPTARSFDPQSATLCNLPSLTPLGDPLKLMTSTPATPTIPLSILISVGLVEECCAALVSANAIASRAIKLNPRIAHMISPYRMDDAHCNCKGSRCAYFTS